ncbi:ABC transporter permease [soil metagenome]
MQILRTITRRPSRSILTALGIAIGIFALVVVGALAERVQQIVGGGVSYYGTRIIVQDAGNDGNFFRLTNPINLDRLEPVRALDGVAAAFPEVTMLYADAKRGENSFGQPPFIIGRDPEANQQDPQPLKVRAGRDLAKGERSVVVLGVDLQKQLGAKVGETIIANGATFTVVGVYDKNFTINDTAAVMPLLDAQLLNRSPITSTGEVSKLGVTDTASQIVVFAEPSVDPQLLTKQITTGVPGVKALDPESFKRQVANSTRLFNTVVFGAALIALLIGSLSVVNTMVMAVAERTREIGIRKAIGATDGRILRDFIAEAAVIGLLGGLLGIFFGELLVLFINRYTASNGSVLFQVSPRLLLGAYSFSVILAVLAGLWPAFKASRMQPIDALNRER